MREITLIPLLALAISLSLPLTAAADGHEDPPNLTSVYVVYPKDGHEADLEAAIKSYGNWRKAAGDTRPWQIFQAVTGTDMAAFFIRYCCFHWGDQDAYEAWELESGAVDAYQEQMGVHVDRLEHYFWELDYANSNWPEDLPDYHYFGVTYWTPKPGGGRDHMRAMARFSAVAKENGWPYPWSWSTRIGGGARVALVTPYLNYAAMDRDGPNFFDWFASHTSQEQAEEAYRMFGDSFWSSTYDIYRWRPDLSMSED